MIEKMWLYPPLAFARLGPSPEPCENYRYGPNDLTPRGTGKTVAVPAPSLVVAADGTLTERPPQGNRVRFKDARGWRPICPFFEVHGTWVIDGVRDDGPITTEVLDAFGLTPADVQWKVEVANLKAHQCSRAEDDRIDAAVEVAGNQHEKRPLEGRSPQGAARPLVPSGRHIPLGAVQIPRPSADFPELRMRFTPAAGLVYGPTDLLQRTDRYPLPAERLFLSANSRWCEFRAVRFDPRTAPSGLYAGASLQDGGTSFGLVDDVCDGLVTVTVGELTARARVVVTPPDFAPDRRPFTSLADGLTDRVKRAEVREPAYISQNPQLTALEVRDLFERALEAMDAVNVDAQNQRATNENIDNAQGEGSPIAEARARTFPEPVPLAGITLALTERGRRKHRRFPALEVLEDLIREQPDFIQRFVRPPATEDPWYDRRMPVAVRGSDAFPMHLTRRQYDLLVAWARSVRANVEEGS
ncbi:hypothetical protein STRCI_000241 [Streptomyces cinnabarinus]|uniref:Uncharacterized protein n=1 Tax=Streptomyces cinnabarinus TaxID=67287 RepID=A0ABY7K7S4_9ACTN|nr:hypothetical protein [Streptomyces cinnabarinus]WAZ19207.1 hypothetical protein STRCI_000241 [Streptomyces cinnabarinus]